MDILSNLKYAEGSRKKRKRVGRVKARVTAVRQPEE